MLAGYLPFDDDPANPEGDNINLLYKYIVSTPLTFPEYVSPHARDLLKRILVAEPRRRADLFEVARHSWLSDYSHVVGFIGSSTKSDRDIAASAMQQHGADLAFPRSASLRESASKSPHAPQKQPPPCVVVDSEPPRQRDAKRRTVQLEYVPPRGSSARGDAIPSAAASAKPQPRDASAAADVKRDIPRKEVPAAPRPARDHHHRVLSDSSAPALPPPHHHHTSMRPSTGASLAPARLPSRGNSYSQPAMATPTPTNAHGRFSQPTAASGQAFSGPQPATDRPASQHNLAQFQAHNQRLLHKDQPLPPHRGHKRSSTLGSIGDRIMGRKNSRRLSSSQQPQDPPAGEKKSRSHPPVSMRNNVSVSAAAAAATDSSSRRSSTESSRRPSFAFVRKASVEDGKRSSRRFSSFLPAGFALPFGGAGKRLGAPLAPNGAVVPVRASRSPSLCTTRSDRDPERLEALLLLQQQQQQRRGEPLQRRDEPLQRRDEPRYDKPLPSQPAAYPDTSLLRKHAGDDDDGYGDGGYPPDPSPPCLPRKQLGDDDDGYGNGNGNADGYGDAHHYSAPPPERFFTPAEDGGARREGYAAGEGEGGRARNGDGYHADSGYQKPAAHGYHADGGGQAAPPATDDPYLDNDGLALPPAPAPPGSSRQHIRPSQRKFASEYDHGHGGSSSATRRVMDFFRRRGRERGGE